MLWSDNTKRSSISEPPLRGKQVVKCHAGKSKRFLEYSLLLCGKQLSMSYPDYHDDMSKIVFKD